MKFPASLARAFSFQSNASAPDEVGLELDDRNASPGQSNRTRRITEDIQAGTASSHGNIRACKTARSSGGVFLLGNVQLALLRRQPSEGQSAGVESKSIFCVASKLPMLAGMSVARLASVDMARMGLAQRSAIRDLASPPAQLSAHQDLSLLQNPPLYGIDSAEEPTRGKRDLAGSWP
ncbi:hypothetical protein IFR05_001818 [Cadophora sp. M221]|nr:hypothetical protein IFR05_001818 [Cadophora sp. M221]